MDPEAGRVDERELLQLGDPLQLVLQLDLAEPLQDRRLEGEAASAGAAVVHRPDEEPLRGEDVVEERRPSPPFLDDLRVRAAVDVDDDRVPASRGRSPRA